MVILCHATYALVLHPQLVRMSEPELQAHVVTRGAPKVRNELDESISRCSDSKQLASVLGTLAKWFTR